jgi:hypothetical protein
MIKRKCACLVELDEQGDDCPYITEKGNCLHPSGPCFFQA